MSDETCGTCLSVVTRGLVAVLPCPSGLPLFGMNSTRRSLSLAWVKGPVSCALMSGLLRDICRCYATSAAGHHGCARACKAPICRACSRHTAANGFA